MSSLGWNIGRNYRGGYRVVGGIGMGVDPSYFVSDEGSIANRWPFNRAQSNFCPTTTLVIRESLLGILLNASRIVGTITDPRRVSDHKQESREIARTCGCLYGFLGQL